jgi:hypothetical protein
LFNLTTAVNVSKSLSPVTFGAEVIKHRILNDMTSDAIIKKSKVPIIYSLRKHIDSRDRFIRSLKHLAVFQLLQNLIRVLCYCSG